MVKLSLPDPTAALEWTQRNLMQISSKLSQFSTLQLVCGCAAVVLVLIVLKYLQFRWRVYRCLPIPHPPVSFPFGNVAMLSTYLESVKKICDEYSSKDGLASFYIGSEQFVLAYKHEHIKQVFSSSSFRAEIPGLRKHFDEFLGRFALTSLMHDEWAFHRKLMLQAFKYAELQRMASDMIGCAHNLVDFLNAKCTANGANAADSKGAPPVAVAGGKAQAQVEMFSTLKTLTFDIIGLAAFGCNFQGIKNLDSGIPPVAQAFAYLLQESGRRTYSLNPLDWYYWLPTKLNRKHKEMQHILRHAVDSVISQRISEGRIEDSHEDFLKYMLTATDESSGKRLSHQALIDNVVTIKFAGFDTTAIVLTFALYLLATNPEAEKTLWKEVDSVLGDRKATYADVNSLNYCTNVIKETLRLYPSAPLTTRTLEKELKLGDTVLPAGQHVWVPMFYAQRHPHNFPDRPNDFIPDRFDADVPIGAWSPFSGGARVCIGMKFALMEGTLVLATLARHFQFRVPEDYVFKVGHLGVTMVPANGMPLIVSKRNH